VRLLLTTDTVGGVWTYAIDLARALTLRGVEVTLAATGPALAHERIREAEESGAELYTREAALEWMDNPWEDVEESGEWLLELADETDPDVVHLNEYAHGSLDWGRPVLVVGHSCVLSWSEAVGGAPPPERYRRTVTDGLAGADIVIAPTRWMLERLDRLYRPPGRMGVIPNGRDPRLFRRATKEPFVLTCGRLWDPGKNAAALDRVAGACDWPIFAVGDAGGWSPRTLRLLGRVDAHELTWWMARAAVYAAPARYEPFGLAPLEAALSGCALLLGDIPSLREVWGETALYVDPEDDEAIRAALAQLTEDEPLRRSLARAAQLRAARFGAVRMAHHYLTEYTQLTPARAAAV